MFLTVCCAILLSTGGIDTTRVPASPGPTIGSARLGLAPLPRELVMSPDARRGDSQLTGGLIGAAVLGTVAVLLANGWNNHNEATSQSLILTAAAAAAAGFVIGVLVAGPDS